VENPLVYDKNLQLAKVLERNSEKKAARKDTVLIAPKMALRHKVVVDPLQQRQADTGGKVTIPQTSLRHRMLMEDVQAIFQKIDVNESGTIEKDEIIRVLEEDELIRDFCTQIPALRPLLDKTEWEETFRTIDTNEDGVISMEEFAFFFAPVPPVTSGIIEFQMEKMGPADGRGAIDKEMEEVKGSIIHEVATNPDDEYTTEYTITVAITTPSDPPPDFNPWLKRLSASIKTLAEKLAYLSPSLSLNSPIYSQKLLHSLVAKAKEFKFMSPILARSPSALGCYTRSPTPGLRDGFSPYPPRPGSSLL